MRDLGLEGSPRCSLGLANGAELQRTLGRANRQPSSAFAPDEARTDSRRCDGHARTIARSRRRCKYAEGYARGIPWSGFKLCYALNPDVREPRIRERRWLLRTGAKLPTPRHPQC